MKLDRFFNRDEIYSVLKMMYSNKVSGSDGMNVIFFIKFWYIMGGDVVNFVIVLLEGFFEMIFVNFINVMLILKKNNIEI